MKNLIGSSLAVGDRQNDADDRSSRRLNLKLPLAPQAPTLGTVFRNWWREQRRTASTVEALRRVVGVAREFIHDSLPEQKRRLYGDVDYDWEHHVNTTSGGVSWRARLIGLLSSAYQPMEQELFYAMLDALGIEFKGFTFVDIGSGKGRALMMASDYPFRKITGIELLPELHKIAQENIQRYSNLNRQCGDLESICGDALRFDFPLDPLVVYLFHPLPEGGFTAVIDNLEKSWRENPRSIYIVYANPIFERVITLRANFHKIGGTHQFSVFRLGDPSGSSELTPEVD